MVVCDFTANSRNLEEHQQKAKNEGSSQQEDCPGPLSDELS